MYTHCCFAATTYNINNAKDHTHNTNIDTNTTHTRHDTTSTNTNTPNNTRPLGGLLPYMLDSYVHAILHYNTLCHIIVVY